MCVSEIFLLIIEQNNAPLYLLYTPRGHTKTIFKIHIYNKLNNLIFSPLCFWISINYVVTNLCIGKFWYSVVMMVEVPTKTLMCNFV